ncbi:MAG: CAP domain-containing protein [Rhodobacteraceae bacterium]|nr:CAP domain-containing protein [Paracoccaceae bacterium]
MTPQQSIAASCAVPSNSSALLGAVGPLLERARRGVGSGEVLRNTMLDTAAQEQACYVARKGLNQAAPHNGSGGSSVTKRVKRAGYRSCLTAENLGVNFNSAEAVMRAWMNSPGHRSNIALKGVREYGVGLAMLGQQPVWVLVLAKPC